MAVSEVKRLVEDQEVGDGGRSIDYGWKDREVCGCGRPGGVLG